MTATQPALTQGVNADHPWMTIAQAAARAQVSAATVRRELKAGRLRGIRIGGRRCLRFRPQWIDAWLEGDEAGR